MNEQEEPDKAPSLLERQVVKDLVLLLACLATIGLIVLTGSEAPPPHRVKVEEARRSAWTTSLKWAHDIAGAEGMTGAPGFEQSLARQHYSELNAKIH